MFILLFLGLACLAFLAVDFLTTTIGTGSAGPLTRWVSSAAFWLMKRLPAGSFLHAISGVVVMTVLGSAWIILFGLSWTLIFSAHPDAVVMANSEEATGILLDFSHVGHLLSTVGGGITKPGNPYWAAASVFVGINGMLVLTLSVSFILNTTRTVSQSRSLLALAEALAPIGPNLPAPLLSVLSSVTSALRSDQLALFYSSSRPSRRIARGLCRLYHASGLNGDARRQMRVLMRELPGMHGVTDADFSQALQRWSQRYELSRTGANY